MTLTRQQQEGEVILVDKPLRWTSFDVVKKIKNLSKYKKVGHAGTLDPLATGLLIVCTGKKTKTIQTYQDWEKEYIGTMVIGKTTPSVDLETNLMNEKDISHIRPDQIHQAFADFRGWIDQIPPIYSAIKVHGERVYEKARKGETAKLLPRQVEIKTLEIINMNLPEISFKLVCSKGTYVRSLVRDIGEKLNVGAYLLKLRRTRIGQFKVDRAFTIEQLQLENIFNE
ncbi:MAG: tRNA pseudouridine(55) synthase TruB [Candidatus Cyclobacteriaceae bacterium M3_2C_046]